jgi:hypothetical protein
MMLFDCLNYNPNISGLSGKILKLILFILVSWYSIYSQVQLGEKAWSIEREIWIDFR